MSEQSISVAVLAGGGSRRFGSEKALAKFKGEPLVQRMLAIARRIAPAPFVVTSSEAQAEILRPVVGKRTAIYTDPEDAERCALTGAITAFEFSKTRYTMLLPVDTPLASVPLLRAIAGMAAGHGAVVPSWPSGYVEPLHAVYLTEHAYVSGLRVYEKGARRMTDLLSVLDHVLYVSTLVLKTFDKNLSTFSNVNTDADLRELERKSHRGG